MKTIATKHKALFFLLLTYSLVNAQISGNQVYGNSSSNYNNAAHSNKTIVVNNNVLSVSISILMNSKADGFVMTLGLNEEAETVTLCNTKINSRIDGFLAKIKALGIKKEESYVDFISQTKVYDFTVDGSTAQQFEKGFEIKKNIIITTANINHLEKIITMASEYEIHDIIKVEYFNEDTDQIHTNLFEQALEMADVKKDRYLKSFRKKIVGTPDANESFEVYFPKNQYKTYQAYESSEIQTHYNNRNTNYLKKLARKNKSFYYDGVSSAGFDKVINANQTEVGIQYTLTLTVSYKIDTSI
ncbi:SIMPL domain-containing protein [Flavobacterium ponti]|uniref:SIMPL domain-containing protein n=1 Tax=Flavobacterium ponti TaxID=665133 RepID=A0ABV9P2Y8_9FLAO